MYNLPLARKYEDIFSISPSRSTKCSIKHTRIENFDAVNYMYYCYCADMTHDMNDMIKCHVL